MRAPIVLFVYKRLDQTKRTVEALQNNLYASDSELFIYADGARSANDHDDVQAVRRYIKTINGFKKVSIIESTTNKGLAISIVEGVTAIVEKFERVIVLEDDIVTSPFFLKYMNDSLCEYVDEPSVMSISGYMYPHKEQLPSTFFFNVPLCWGWATWKRAWSLYKATPRDYIAYLNQTGRWKEFNKFGGRYLERQLRRNADGSRSTWFIYWHAAVFMNNGFCLFPSRTLVHNIGFDSSGEHGASTSSYYSVLSDSEVVVKKQPLVENLIAGKIIRYFYRFTVNPYMRRIKKILRKLFN